MKREKFKTERGCNRIIHLHFSYSQSSMSLLMVGLKLELHGSVWETFLESSYRTPSLVKESFEETLGDGSNMPLVIKRSNGCIHTLALVHNKGLYACSLFMLRIMPRFFRSWLCLIFRRSETINMFNGSIRKNAVASILGATDYEKVYMALLVTSTIVDFIDQPQ